MKKIEMKYRDVGTAYEVVSIKNVAGEEESVENWAKICGQKTAEKAWKNYTSWFPYIYVDKNGNVRVADNSDLNTIWTIKERLNITKDRLDKIINAMKKAGEKYSIITKNLTRNPIYTITI